MINVAYYSCWIFRFYVTIITSYHMSVGWWRKIAMEHSLSCKHVEKTSIVTSIREQLFVTSRTWVSWFEHLYEELQYIVTYPRGRCEYLGVGVSIVNIWLVTRATATCSAQLAATYCDMTNLRRYQANHRNLEAIKTCNCYVVVRGGAIGFRVISRCGE